MTALRVLFSFLCRELDPGPHIPRAPCKRQSLRPPPLRLAPVALLALLVALLALLASGPCSFTRVTSSFTRVACWYYLLASFAAGISYVVVAALPALLALALLARFAFSAC
jgi:lysylphosphatidylglycerol synthetase-like protein (DUF2156 family)